MKRHLLSQMDLSAIARLDGGPGDIRFMGVGVQDATNEGSGSVLHREPSHIGATLQQTILAALPELAERTRAQLLELVREPSVARCDAMLRELSEVSTHVRRLSSNLSQSPTV